MYVAVTVEERVVRTAMAAARKPVMKEYTLDKHDVDALVADLPTLKKP